jgi:hypothetical protein
MNKVATIVFVVLATAVVAAANTASKGHQCVPEPITMLALIPGVGMLLRRRKNSK